MSVNKFILMRLNDGGSFGGERKNMREEENDAADSELTDFSISEKNAEKERNAETPRQAEKRSWFSKLFRREREEAQMEIKSVKQIKTGDIGELPASLTADEAAAADALESAVIKNAEKSNILKIDLGDDIDDIIMALQEKSDALAKIPLTRYETELYEKLLRVGDYKQMSAGEQAELAAIEGPAINNAVIEKMINGEMPWTVNAIWRVNNRLRQRRHPITNKKLDPEPVVAKASSKSDDEPEKNISGATAAGGAALGVALAAALAAKSGAEENTTTAAKNEKIGRPVAEEEIIDIPGFAEDMAEEYSKRFEKAFSESEKIKKELEIINDDFVILTEGIKDAATAKDRIRLIRDNIAIVTEHAKRYSVLNSSTEEVGKIIQQFSDAHFISRFAGENFMTDDGPETASKLEDALTAALNQITGSKLAMEKRLLDLTLEIDELTEKIAFYDKKQLPIIGNNVAERINKQISSLSAELKKQADPESRWARTLAAELTLKRAEKMELESDMALALKKDQPTAETMTTEQLWKKEKTEAGARIKHLVKQITVCRNIIEKLKTFPPGNEINKKIIEALTNLNFFLQKKDQEYQTVAALNKKIKEAGVPSETIDYSSLDTAGGDYEEAENERESETDIQTSLPDKETAKEKRARELKEARAYLHSLNYSAPAPKTGIAPDFTSPAGGDKKNTQPQKTKPLAAEKIEYSPFDTAGGDATGLLDEEEQKTNLSEREKSPNKLLLEKASLELDNYLMNGRKAIEGATDKITLEDILSNINRKLLNITEDVGKKQVISALAEMAILSPEELNRLKASELQVLRRRRANDLQSLEGYVKSKIAALGDAPETTLAENTATRETEDAKPRDEKTETAITDEETENKAIIAKAETALEDIAQKNLARVAEIKNDNELVLAIEQINRTIDKINVARGATKEKVVDHLAEFGILTKDELEKLSNPAIKKLAAARVRQLNAAKDEAKKQRRELTVNADKKIAADERKADNTAAQSPEKTNQETRDSFNEAETIMTKIGEQWLVGVGANDMESFKATMDALSSADLNSYRAHLVDLRLPQAMADTLSDQSLERLRGIETTALDAAYSKAKKLRKKELTDINREMTKKQLDKFGRDVKQISDPEKINPEELKELAQLVSEAKPGDRDAINLIKLAIQKITRKQ
jgi:hypothetical protein